MTLLYRLASVVLSLPLLLSAQGIDIRGVVSDSTTGEKLPFTNVILTGTERGAATNLNGFYLIPNVQPGHYELVASAVGYVRKTQPIAVGGEGPLIVNFRLTSTAVELSEVVVTEAGKRELQEINTSIHVLDQRDIKLVPVTVQEDVFRSIQILPGVVSTSDVNSHFYVRGGGGDQNLILLDGMKIYNPFHAFGIFSVFDADIIKTTEVYTGAFPPGLGGRLSSVVSMTTRDGKSTGIAGRANINFLSSKVQVEGPAGEQFQWLVSGRKSLFPKTLSRFLQTDVPMEFYDGFVKVTRQGGEDSRFALQGFFSGDNLRSPQFDEPNYTWRTHAIGFTASGLIQDRVFVNAVAYENSFEAVRDPKSSQAITPSSTTVREMGVRADATLYTDSHDLYFFGFEFSFPTLEYKLVNTFGVQNRVKGTPLETWVWVRYQTSVGPLKMDGGVHTDVASIFLRQPDFNVLQPRLNLSYTVWEDWRLKFSFGRFSQNLITVNNEDDVISIFDAWIPVPDELETERADHVVAGIDGNITRELSTSVQTYYKRYRSLVTYNRDKVDALDPDYVNSEGNSYGVEALVRFGIPLVDLYGTYTLGFTSIRSGDFTYHPRHDRRHTINLLGVLHPLPDLDVTLRWEFGTGFPFTQTVGYYDRLKFPDLFDGEFGGETGEPYSILGPKNAARLPMYHRLDASLTYRFSVGFLRGNVGLHVINVYNHKNLFYFDRRTGQRINMLPFFPSATVNLEY